MGQQVDYLALAKQFGGVPATQDKPDPLEVAKQFGGVPQRTPSETLSGATGIGAAPNRFTEALPNVGGMVGSVLGGSRSNPIGMLLAAIGGAGGEGYRQALSAWEGKWDQVPPDLQSQVKAIIAEGVKQGGLEAGGRYIVGPVLKVLGRSMYRSALKPSIEVRREFGGREVTDTLVDAGIPITRLGVGTERTAQMLKDAGQDTARTIASAEAAGAKPSTMRPVVKSLERTRAKVSDRVVRGPATKEVDAMRDAALAENPGRIPVSRLQTMKQAEQDLAIQAYKAEAKGAPVNSVDTSMHEDLARGLREAIERRIPSIADKNKRTQDIIGALKAISQAEGRIANNNLVGMGDMLSLGTGLGAVAMTGRPSAAALAVLQEVLTRPEIASRLGIAMDRSGRPMITPQAMRVVSETINQLAGDDATGLVSESVAPRHRTGGPAR